jgi:hypothetical protein
MTETRTDDRMCSQHRQPRSECRPDDRHTQPLRCGDGLMAAVRAKAEAIGLTTTNDALELALQAWLRAPLREVAEQALAERRIKRLPDGLETASIAAPAARKNNRTDESAPAAAKAVRFVEPAR